MKHILTIIAALILSACGAGMNEAQAQNMTLSGNGIEIKTCAHDAGAQCSLTFRGKQYVDDFDHGRQIQSAIVYDHQGENFNPTEAGGFYNGMTPRPSSSVFEAGKVIQHLMTSTIRMAYWNKVKGVALSDNKVRKEVFIGVKGIPNVISYTVTFTRPAEEVHTWGQYEALTGYMPVEFNTFYRFNVKGHARYPEPIDLQHVRDVPGEQQYPVIICTTDNYNCMGTYAPHLPQAQWANEAGYGRWSFKNEKVSKWNMVFRGPNPAAFQPFQVYVIVGSLDEVVSSIRLLHKAVGVN